MSQIRVLHVIARMNVGGTATYLASLIKSLEREGVKNLLAMGHVPRGETEDEIVKGLPIIRVADLSREISAANDFASWKKLQAIIDDFKPDIIHSHTFKAGLLVRLGKKRAPVVHSFHGHHIYDPEFGPIRRTGINVVERILAGKSDAIVTIGKRVMEELLAKRIGQRSQYFPIAPGIVDMKLADGNKVRKRFGIGLNEVVVVWLGRFTKVKRPDRVIEVAKEMPDISFVMAGGGELMDSVWESAPANVKLVGFQSKNDMWSIADIGLCTSDSEGMPLALIEAQMAGVPVVSTDVGSVSEIIEDNKTGKLAGRESQQLVVALKEVVNSISKSERMQKASRDRAIKLFSAEVMAKNHLTLYRSLLDNVQR